MIKNIYIEYYRLKIWGYFHNPKGFQLVNPSPIAMPWAWMFLAACRPFCSRAHPTRSWPNPLRSEPDSYTQIDLEMISLREKWRVSYVESPGCSWISIRKTKGLAAHICIPSDCIDSVSMCKLISKISEPIADRTAAFESWVSMSIFFFSACNPKRQFSIFNSITRIKKSVPVFTKVRGPMSPPWSGGPMSAWSGQCLSWFLSVGPEKIVMAKRIKHQWTHNLLDMLKH